MEGQVSIKTDFYHLISPGFIITHLLPSKQRVKQSKYSTRKNLPWLPSIQSSFPRLLIFRSRGQDGNGKTCLKEEKDDTEDY